MFVRSRKSARSGDTRAALLRVARKEFAKRGYAGTAAEEIARRAGVTRGTLYYQFRDKKALFLEVCDQLERECSERITTAGLAAPGLWEQLRAGCEAALDTFLDPTYLRIMVLDGPAVLGWETWRGLLSKYGRDLLRRGLRDAMDRGLIDRQPLEPLAHVLTGAVNEAGLVIAHTKDVRRARVQFGVAIARLLEGLRAAGRGRSLARRR